MPVLYESALSLFLFRKFEDFLNIYKRIMLPQIFISSIQQICLWFFFIMVRQLTYLIHRFYNNYYVHILHLNDYLSE